MLAARRIHHAVSSQLSDCVRNKCDVILLECRIKITAETTGLDTKADEVIEIGMVKFVYSADCFGEGRRKGAARLAPFAVFPVFFITRWGRLLEPVSATIFLDPA
jgi:hypothetical protein